MSDESNVYHFLLPSKWVDDKLGTGLVNARTIEMRHLEGGICTAISIKITRETINEAIILALAKINSLKDEAEADALARLIAMHQLHAAGIGTPSPDPAIEDALTKRAENLADRLP